MSIESLTLLLQLVVVVVSILVIVLIRIHYILDDEKELKEQFKKERDMAKAIVSSMGEGVLVLDTNYKIELINPTGEKLLETTKQEAVGQKWAGFVNAFVGDKKITFEQRSSVKVLKKGEVRVTTITDDHYYETRSGRRFPIVSITAPLVHDEKVIGVVKVFRDASKEKEIDRMKTEFISLASHQLRTPLSAIKWFTELLIDKRSGRLNVEQKDYTDNIAFATERMIELVNSLLNISRIESGRIIIEPRPTGLSDLVKKVVIELQKKIKDKKIQFIISIHHKLPLINIDPKLIRHVYMNLIENAIKYTPDRGEISVFISRKNNELISQVTDTGYGIPKNEQTRVFQKFYRGSNILKHVTEGTGLGLYLIKSIVESSGGKIWFQSPTFVEKISAGKQDPRGTTFWFSLPVKGIQPKKGEVSLDV